MDNTTWLSPERSADLDRLDREEWDLLIVGGGITGAALAYVAAHARPALRVALVERDDFASGTSSRSSRLLHGGLRYLAQGRFGLVRALLQGRRELTALAPHLARSAAFLLPHPGRAWKTRAGLRLYTAMAGEPGAQVLDRAGAVRAEPALDGHAFTGALTYNETSTHDAQLVWELAAGAAAAGAVVLNRVACEDLVHEGTQVVGARLRDRVTGTPFFARAKVVVNATGPWCDRLPGQAMQKARVRLSRGTHLVFSPHRLPLQHTVVMFSPRDNRALFASPRDGFVLVGTTETEHHGSPDAVTPTAGDRAYLLEAVQSTFPDLHIGPADVATSFAGVRPLATGTSSDPGALDRGYVVRWEQPGLLSVCGGKLTLALTGARQVLAAVGGSPHARGVPRVIATPHELPVLPGARIVYPAVHSDRFATQPTATVAHRMYRQGAQIGADLALRSAVRLVAAGYPVAMMKENHQWKGRAA